MGAIHNMGSRRFASSSSSESFGLPEETSAERREWARQQVEERHAEYEAYERERAERGPIEETPEQRQEYCELNICLREQAEAGRRWRDELHRVRDRTRRMREFYRQNPLEPIRGEPLWYTEYRNWNYIEQELANNRRQIGQKYRLDTSRQGNAYNQAPGVEEGFDERHNSYYIQEEILTHHSRPQSRTHYHNAIATVLSSFGPRRDDQEEDHIYLCRVHVDTLPEDFDTDLLRHRYRVGRHHDQDAREEDVTIIVRWQNLVPIEEDDAERIVRIGRENKDLQQQTEQAQNQVEELQALLKTTKRKQKVRERQVRCAQVGAVSVGVLGILCVSFGPWMCEHPIISTLLVTPPLTWVYHNFCKFTEEPPTISQERSEYPECVPTDLQRPKSERTKPSSPTLS